ncbi:MAG: S-layer homology domain-containing protein, partial [Clostridia bacterium]|nr:S-layer homology domain-containing protein [Clostridia bacterium]
SKRPVGTGSTTVETPADNKVVVNFSDLGEAAWASTAIKALAEDGVVSGKGDGKFYPNDTVTREEFVKIIVEALDIYNKNASASFDDVQDSRWSYGYIASAVHAGIIKGVSDTEFNPAGTMSRQDMAVIMYRVAGLLGLDVAGDSSVFADNADIADYAKEAVGALSGAGIINGTGNDCFSPKGTVTRAQAAKVVYEVLNAVGGAK